MEAAKRQGAARTGEDARNSFGRENRMRIEAPAVGAGTEPIIAMGKRRG
ncbi:hypothetical protein C100_10685 [Sphingobium sp. C100]|nr:hypothetical protein C100_10685 [Sphingobium sp. C100]